MPVIDLHTHSKHSDGTSRPSELVVEAAKKGAVMFCLADHDTLAGTGEARQKCEKYNIHCLSGTEVSTCDHDQLHFLAYGVSEEDKDFAKFLEQNRAVRVKRIDKTIALLQAAGLDITKEDVLALSKSTLSRAHIADALVKKKLAVSRQEAFRKYLVPGAAGYVPAMGANAQTAIKAIVKAGGRPVIAHPGLSKAAWNFAAWVKEGLAGIEVFYPSHNGEMKLELMTLAEKYNLFVTAGSDFHGKSHSAKIGMDIPFKYYERLLEEFF